MNDVHDAMVEVRGRTIVLQPGEHYAGTIISADGTPYYDLILLDGSADSVSWDAAKDWAKEQGGELPTRREQRLLAANLKDQFEAAWYWSSELYDSYEDCAWCQRFDDGNQNFTNKDNKLRTRAVRRLVIVRTK